MTYFRRMHALAVLSSILLCVAFLFGNASRGYAAVNVGSASTTSIAGTLNAGLIGRWTFDGADTLSGAILDKSGHANTAHVNGIATSTFYVAGKIGQGAFFDGVNDYAVTDATTWGVSNTLTLSAWVKTTANSVAVASLGRATVTDEAMLYIHNNAASVIFSNGAFLYNGIYGGTVINDGKWHHLVATVSGSNTCGAMKLYVDGVREGTENCFSGSGSDVSDASPRSFFLGWRAWGGGSAEIYQGTMDEVRLYNRVLTATEARKLFQASRVVEQVSRVGRATANLMGYWSFDRADISSGLDTAYDRSGQGRNGTLYNLATSSISSGRIGQALNFNGANSYISVSTLDSNTVSVFAWIKSTAGTTQVVVDSLTNGGWGLYVDTANKLRFTKRGTSEVISTGTIPIAGWHHVGATYDGTNVRFYIDGMLSGTQAFSQTFSNGGSNYGIGGLNSSGSTINGKLDEVRVYGRTLIVTEIVQLYRLGTVTVNGSRNISSVGGLIGLWSFDRADMLSTAVYDRSGQSYNGVLMNMTATTSAAPGRVGQGLRFDNVSDHYIEVPNLDRNTFSVGAWIKKDTIDPGHYEEIILSENNGGWAFGIDSPASKKLFLSVTGVSQVSSTGGILDKRWHHVFLTYDGANARFYVDGALDSTLPYVVTFNSSGGVYNIGGRNGSGATLAGTMDELRLYSRVLSSSEISTIYRQGK